MDPMEAEQQLQTADSAYRAAALPTLPPRIALPCAVMIGAAVALSGQHSANGLIQLSYWISAVALAAGAVGLTVRARRQRGLTGLRGPARTALTTLLTCALSLLTIAICAGPGMGWIYLGLGVVVGVVAAAVLRRPRYLLPRQRR
ncbi:hypothetical protein [Nocardia ninae]|nr:hypothetical protein [Nocardia ninae]